MMKHSIVYKDIILAGFSIAAIVLLWKTAHYTHEEGTKEALSQKQAMIHILK